MADNAPQNTPASGWIIPPGLPPGINLNLSSLIKTDRLTPEALGHLAEFLKATQAVNADVNAAIPNCPNLASCSNYDAGGFGCPPLVSCGTYTTFTETVAPVE